MLERKEYASCGSQFCLRPMSVQDLHLMEAGAIN